MTRYLFKMIFKLSPTSPAIPKKFPSCKVTAILTQRQDDTGRVVFLLPLNTAITQGSHLPSKVIAPLNECRLPAPHALRLFLGALANGSPCRPPAHP